MHHGHCDCGPFRITMLPPGILKPLILRLLVDHPQHGYEIMAQIFERTRGMWRPTPASIYPALQSLLTRGYIREADAGGRARGERARRPYEITQKGRLALKDYDRFRTEWEEHLSRLRDLWW